MSEPTLFYDLPLTPAGDRTFMCAMGGATFGFRSYYVVSSVDGWYLDVYDSQYQPLAVGRRLVTGSINILAGYANALDRISAVVYDAEGVKDTQDALGGSLLVGWFPTKSDNFLEKGEPMDFLFENFNLAK